MGRYTNPYLFFAIDAGVEKTLLNLKPNGSSNPVTLVQEQNL
jgi:hypothetical protein